MEGRKEERKDEREEGRKELRSMYVERYRANDEGVA